MHHDAHPTAAHKEASGALGRNNHSTFKASPTRTNNVERIDHKLLPDLSGERIPRRALDLNRALLNGGDGSAAGCSGKVAQIKCPPALSLEGPLEGQEPEEPHSAIEPDDVWDATP